MLYNDSFLFDPFDETRIVSSASITTNVNAASYLDFTIAANHPLYNEIEQRSGTITLYSDNEKLFQGQITAIDMDMDGNKSVTCSSALDWLRDVQLRPYSTDQAECDGYEFKLDKAPDALDAYFQWLIDQYNAQNKDGRYFTINVNQAADLTRHSIVYFASTSPRSVADAIEDDILKTFGGYLVLRYEDDQLILDLYSDIHEMNEQVIDYGENILDISRNESTDDQYTAVYPIGKTPQYTAEQQKYHDEKAAYDERMKQREETEKAAINQLKKEEEAEQKRINGMPKGQAKKNAQNALKQRKEQRQAREKAFSDETKRLQDAQKIKDDKNSADKTKPNPITIESLDNGGYEGDLDIFKEGDVLYSVSYVARYGYKEFVYSETDVDDKNELLKLAVAKLKTLMAPSLTIDVRAVDQALYNPKHTHLFAGQAVRVRSKPHGVDEFMMVSSIDLDLIDPSQTTATLGVAYDTLTGQQSSFLRNLNSQIVASVDAVDKLGEDVKVTEITLGRVETVVDNVAADNDLIINTVDDYKWMTDTAWGKADDAQESADEANQGVTDTNVRIDNIKMATDERIDGMETDISGIHDSINDTKAEIVTIKENAEQIRQDAQAGIDEAKQQAEDVRTEANTAIDGVKTDLAATEAKAEQARQNASTALGGLSSANAQINGLRIDVNRHQENITNIDGEIVGVKDTISGVAETANSALTVATTNTNAINEQSTRIDTAYSDIEATRTSVSEVKQTADGLKVNLETNYLDKDALGANYASKAELTATSESITSTVEKTYATKSALEGLQNIADAAIETWSGRAVPTTSNAPASTWTTNALKKQHSGDIYYDMTTGKSYRWGSEDGKVYSWSMIADSDITKAIADAAKAQQTANGAKQDVVNLSNDVKATYTSKSEFKQTSDEIKASVNEVASANETNTRKIAEVSVKADGISAKVEEQAETISGHSTTIGQLSVKADGLQTKFEQVSTSLDSALTKTSDLEQNLNGFKQTVTESYLKKGDAETKYTSKSEFTQTANEIRGTVAEQATTIDGHTDSIANLSLKANKFETDIKQVTEQATAIAGRTTKLEQDLGGFKQTVSGTYITKTDAEQNLVDAINGMQIGGTNMLLDTRAFGSANPNNIPAHGFSLNYAAQNGTYNQFTYRRIPDTVTTNNPDGPAYYNIPIERGKTYTASFYYRGTADLWVYFHGTNGYVGSVATTASNGFKGTSTYGNDGNVTFAKDSEWKRYWVTWTLHATGGTHLNKALLFRRKGTAGYIDIAGVKLEEGTKATEWSPSPFDTLYASTITSTYATNSKVEQTENRITSTVEQTYATKTQLSDEMRQSLKTFELRGRTDGNYWLKMGRVTMAQQGKDFHIDYTGGRGFNGNPSQNSQLEIHVRSGSGSGTLFGVTLNRLLNADMYTVKAFVIDSTHIDLYMKSGSQYSPGTMAYYGQYSDFSGAKQIEDISTAEGTELTVLEQSLSTKSYVNQTAESVSIGVVEDFKDGKHGDKLTTQSNLTALKDEINASVSKQYADLSDRIKLANSDNAIGKNFSFESNKFEGWASHDDWTIGWNGAHTGRYYAQNTIPANSNGNQLISMGSIAAEYGHTYKLEYWAKKKPNTQCRGLHRISYKRSGRWEDIPSDYGNTIFLDENGTTNVTGGRDYFDVTDSWMKVTTYIIPPSNVTDIRVRIIGNNPGSAETVFAVDDVSLTDYSVAKTINKTMAGISVKADSIVQEVRNDYATKDLVNRSIPGLKNPNFDVQKDGDYNTIAGWSVLGPWAETRLANSVPVSSSEGGTYFVGKSGTTAGQTLELINQGYISAYPGMKVQISWWMSVDANIIQNSNFSAGIIANNVVTRNLLNNYSTGGWKYMTTTVTVPANVNQFRVRFGFVTTGTSGWLRLDSVSVTDVTEANAAMGKATTVETNLEHYKTTVSNTYADKNTVTNMQTQWTQTAQGFEAAITANSHSVSVINSGFESGDLSGWEPWGFIPAEVTNTSLNGNSTYYFKGVTDSSNYHGLKNTGTIVARKNDQIKVSTRILVLDSSGNPVRATVSIGYQASYNQVPYTADTTTTNTGWSVVSATMNVPNDTLCSSWINIKNLRNGYTVCIDDVEMLNVTEAVILRNDLETRIAMTSRGVRVGKVEDGTFKGMSALVNSEGSFDILNGEQVQATMSDSNVGLMRDNTTGRYRFQIKPYSQNGKNGTNLLSYGQVSLNSMPTVPATTSVNCMLPSGTATINSGSSYIMPWDYSYFETNDLFIPYPQEYRTNYYQTISDGAILDDKAYQHAVGILGYDEEDRQSLVFLNPGLYAVQYNAHVLHTSNAYFDYCLRFKTPGSTSWVSIPGAPDWRAIEVGDPAGYLQRTSIVAWVNVDVGTMMQLHVKSSVNGQKLSVANHIHITRMPFGCAIMNQ